MAGLVIDTMAASSSTDSESVPRNLNGQVQLYFGPGRRIMMRVQPLPPKLEPSVP